MKRAIFLLVFGGVNLWGVGQSQNTQYPLPIASSYAEGITTGPDGNIWFTQVDGNAIGKINPTTGVVTEYVLSGASSQGPWDIITGPDGAMWFVTAFSNEIGRITLDGVVTNEWKTITKGSSPRRIRIGPDGKTMWFTEAIGNNIGSITTSGKMTEYPIPTPNSTPSSLCVGPDGAIWFNESAASANQIVRMTTAGVFTNAYPLPTPNSVLGQIIVGPDGNLWVSENASDKIGRLVPPGNPGGGVLTEWVLPTRGGIPSGLIAAPDGALWFTEFGTSQIGRITMDGVISEFPTGGAPSVPWEIVAGPDGGIWYAESKTNAIGRIPDCALGIQASYAAGTLTLNFSVGISSQTEWVTSLKQNGVVIATLWSKPLPVELPLLKTSIPIPLKPIGTFTVNSGLYTTGNTLVCGDGVTVNSGS